MLWGKEPNKVTGWCFVNTLHSLYMVVSVILCVKYGMEFSTSVMSVLKSIGVLEHLGIWIFS